MPLGDSFRLMKVNLNPGEMMRCLNTSSAAASLVAATEFADSSMKTVAREDARPQGEVSVLPHLTPVPGTIFELKPWLLKLVADSESAPPIDALTWADLAPKQK